MSDTVATFILAILFSISFSIGMFIGRSDGAKQADINYYAKHYEKFETFTKKVQFEKEQLDSRKEFEATLNK